MVLNRKQRHEINNTLHEISTMYHPCIPLEAIFAACEGEGVKAVQEDGTTWEGVLCGDKGRARFDLIDDSGNDLSNSLVVTWYRMPSRNFEIVAYVA